MAYGLDGELAAEYAAPNGVHPKPASPTTEYAYRLGEMLIQADASDCKWLVSDHLGSPRIILGKSGSLADTKRRDFMPFGEDLGAGQFGRTTALGYEPAGTPSNPREKFATYERDTAQLSRRTLTVRSAPSLRPSSPPAMTPTPSFPLPKPRFGRSYAFLSLRRFAFAPRACPAFNHIRALPHEKRHARRAQYARRAFLWVLGFRAVFPIRGIFGMDEG
jgi:hypothetical protein